MSDIKLFSLSEGAATEIAGNAVALEKSLQTLIERNLEPLLGARFLASEYATGPRHGGRIDTLAIDENGSPVIIEYKRSTNENVINQGLFYLDWLLDHQAEFKLLVMEQLGADAAESIEWSSPRLLCIAGGFTKYDEHAVQQMDRNIELIRYRRFGDELLLLELVNASSAEGARDTGTTGTSRVGGRTRAVSSKLEHLAGPLRDLYEELRAFLLGLGDDVQEKELKLYIAYKRLKNFACLEIHAEALVVFLKLDPAKVALEEGFTRDMSETGHYGTGDLQVTIRNPNDLERAKVLIQDSYEAS